MEPVTSLDEKRRQVEDDAKRALRLWRVGAYEWEKPAELRLAERGLLMADIGYALREGRVRSRSREGDCIRCEIIGTGVDKEVIRLTLELGEEFMRFIGLN
jgi:hypothetical protein